VSPALFEIQGHRAGPTLQVSALVRPAFFRPRVAPMPGLYVPIYQVDELHRHRKPKRFNVRLVEKLVPFL